MRKTNLLRGAPFQLERVSSTLANTCSLWPCKLAFSFTQPRFIHPGLKPLQGSDCEDPYYDWYPDAPYIQNNLVDRDALSSLVDEARSATRARGFSHRVTTRQNGFGEFMCPRCRKFMPASSFYESPYRGHGISSYCRECSQAYRQCYARTLRGVVKQMMSSARKRSKARLQDCTIDSEYILDMIIKQQGCCYYSNIPMHFHPFSDWMMSLERLDNSVGYNSGNCVLVAVEFNTTDLSHSCKSGEILGSPQWSKAKVNEVRSKRCESVDLDALFKMLETAACPPARVRIASKRESNNLGEWKCSRCSLYKSPDRFHKDAKAKYGMYSMCKECTAQHQSAYYRTLRGKALHLASAARNRNTMRKRESSLTYDDILRMIWQQGGRCYYSGVPMELLLPFTDWRLSLERIDNSLGYSPENCVLVAHEFNSRAQWSRRKVSYVWGTYW